ncbi:MAG: hypothetical protein Q9N67_11860 [Ghiorsea sp.]|nr:hypothetical protein [Ghiorsea sp.]
MKNCYGIKLAHGQVQCCDLARNEYIKNNGERKWHYDDTEFWSFFLKKINYDEETLSFLILSDQNDFPIPSHIRLHHQNSITQKAYNHFLMDVVHINIITKPQASFQTRPATRKSRTAQQEDVFKASPSHIAVAYYQDKTAEYEK